MALYDNTALVGAPYANGGTGAVYVFTYSKTGWTYQRMLSAGAGYSRFGWSVAVSIFGAVIGAPMERDGAGAAYIFTRLEATWDWSHPQKLAPKDLAKGDKFGWSVALYRDLPVHIDYTALVGAPGTNLGYVYTFEQSNAPGPTPFSAFDVTQVLAAPQTLTLKSTLTLDRHSNGIFPLTEPLTLRVGDFTTTLPTGSFTKSRGSFVFVGQVGEVWVEARIFRVRGKTYQFQIWESGRGVSFTPQRFVPIDLTIGDDGGTAAVAR